MMKKAIHIIILMLTGLFLLPTCKNPKIDYESFSITKEIIKPEIHKVVISGEYDLIGEVSSMKLNIGQNEQLIDAESHLMNIDSQSFSVTVDSLSAGSLYYYCYVVEFIDGYKMLTEIGEFTTLSDKPLVKTLEITDGDATSFLVKCLVEDDFGLAITERGIYWNTVGNPGVNDHKVIHEENGVGEYVCKMENLEPNKTYYVRAYAENQIGVGLGDVLFYQTIVTELPTVSTAEVTDITSTSATCGGTVISEGGSPVSSCGVCWSTEHNPTIENDFTIDGSGLGDFMSSLTRLTPNTLYYIRAYATNSFGTNYGEEVSFTALDGLPEVITLEVTDIGYVTAIGHGKVTNEGTSEVTERGICWGLEHNPDLNDGNGHSGTGLGEFEVQMTDLLPNKRYYVRAYATNAHGTVYGNEESFETKATELPTVTTASVGQFDFTYHTAVGGGEVTSDGGDAVTERGIYFGTDPDPVTTGTKIVANTAGIGSFTCTLGGLVDEKTYYVCAYAKNGQGTSYGSVMSFDYSHVPVGAIKGVFSVSSSRKVYFSQGNLQYRASDRRWRFAEHQYDCIGEDNSNISETYSNYIDLFGWGTSGWESGAHCYQPWSTDITPSYYYPGNSYTNDLSGRYANADWGVYNAIYNGGNQAGQWRTLTKDEWVYVFEGRNNASLKYGHGKVNGVNGMILLPDNWTLPLGLSFTAGNSGWVNVYNTEEWERMEDNGAVFLPAAGIRRNGVSPESVGSEGYYWSTSYYNSNSACNVFFMTLSLNLQHFFARYGGCSVRLVAPVE